MEDFDIEWMSREPASPVTGQDDPIWGGPATVHTGKTGGWLIKSDRGGEYLWWPGAPLVSTWPPDSKAKLATWITDQMQAGVSYPAVSSSVLKHIWAAKPLPFASKVDRFFRYLNARGYRVGDVFYSGTNLKMQSAVVERDRLMRWIEATDAKELSGFLNALVGDGFLSTSGGSGYVLAAKGLMRLDAVDQARAETDRVFVAMWFDPSTMDAYENGIKPGLLDAGYRAFRVDEKEHANKIDDEIIAEIRRSRFIVADFTSGTVDSGGRSVCVPRGGVYYEAGFAQGLGMPVIWTVRSDQINDIHFDIRQFNQIVWTDAEDLRMKLTRRVIAILGHFGDNARRIAI